jgi:hypothetical protein
MHYFKKWLPEAHGKIPHAFPFHSPADLAGKTLQDGIIFRK